MTDENPNEAYDGIWRETGLVRHQAAEVPFLIPAAELLDRKIKRRRKQNGGLGRPEAIRRLVEK